MLVRWGGTPFTVWALSSRAAAAPPAVPATPPARAAASALTATATAAAAAAAGGLAAAEEAAGQGLEPVQVDLAATPRRLRGGGVVPADNQSLGASQV
jgi:hypothetical protein